MQWHADCGREFAPARKIIRMNVGLGNGNDSHVVVGSEIRVDVYITPRVDDERLAGRLIAYNV